MAEPDLSWMDPDEQAKLEMQRRLGAGTAKQEIEQADPLFDFTYTPPGMQAPTEGYAYQNVGTEQQPVWSETSYQDILKRMQQPPPAPLGHTPTPYEDIEAPDIGTIETEPVTRGEELFGENPVTDFIGDIGQAGHRGFARARQVVPSIRVARGDESALPAYIRAQERVAALGQSDEMRQFNEYMDQSEGGWGDLFMALGRNPSIAATLPVESLVQYVNPAALSALGTAVGTGAVAGGGAPGALAAFPVGMGAAGALTEGALSFHEFVQEELEKRKLPFSEAAVRKIMQDPELMAEMTRRAEKRGLVVGAVDAVTAGVAGKVGANVLKAGRRATAPKPRYRGSGRLTPELSEQVGEDVLTYGGKEMVGTAGAAMLGTEALGGMGGETAAQILSGQDFDLREVFLEGLGELGPGGVTVAKTFYAENFKKAARDAGVTDPGAMIELDPEAIAQMEAEAKAATLRDLELALDPAHGMGQLGAVSGQSGLTASGPGPSASVYGTPLTEPPLGLTDADVTWLDGKRAPEAQPSGRPVDFTGGALPSVGPDVAEQTRAQLLERTGQQPAQQPLEDLPEAPVPLDAPGMEWREGTDLQTDEQPVTGAEPVDITPELSLERLRYDEKIVDKIAEVADRNFGKSAGYFKPVRRDDPNLVAFVEGTHVEDEKGEATVAWHGAYDPAQQEFILRTDETASPSRELHGRGIYLADRPSTANAWGSGPGGVYPLWVSIKNPWYGRPDQSISPKGQQIIDEWIESETLTDEQESALRENIKKNKWGAPEHSIEFLHPGMGDGVQELWVPPGVKTDALIASGYDGIRLAAAWIIFDPAQAKSAISNTGRVDPDEPKMAYQTIAPEVRPYASFDGEPGAGWTYDSLAAGEFADFLTGGLEPHEGIRTPKSARQVAQYIMDDPRATPLERYLSGKIQPMLRDSRVYIFDETMVNEPLYAEQPFDTAAERALMKRVRRSHGKGNYWGVVHSSRESGSRLSPQVMSFPGPGLDDAASAPYTGSERYNGPRSETIVHELLHVATVRQIYAAESYESDLSGGKLTVTPAEYGITDRTLLGNRRLTDLRTVLGQYTKAAKMHFRAHGSFKGSKFADLDALMKQWETRDGTFTAGTNMSRALEKLSRSEHMGLSNNRELISYGLTNTSSREFLQALSMKEVQTVIDPKFSNNQVFTRLSRAWDVFTDTIYVILGLPPNKPTVHTGLVELLDNVDLILFDLSPEGRKIYENVIRPAESFYHGHGPESGMMGSETMLAPPEGRAYLDPPLAPGMEKPAKRGERAGVMRKSMGVPFSKYKVQIFELILKNPQQHALISAERHEMFDSVITALTDPDAINKNDPTTLLPTVDRQVAEWLSSKYEGNRSVLDTYSEIADIFGDPLYPNKPPEKGGRVRADVQKPADVKVPSLLEPLPQSRGVHTYTTTLDVPRWERRTTHLKEMGESIGKKVPNPYISRLDPQQSAQVAPVPALWSPLTTTPFMNKLTVGERMNAFVHLDDPTKQFQTFIQEQLDLAHPFELKKAHRRAKILLAMIGEPDGVMTHLASQTAMQKRLLDEGMAPDAVSDFMDKAKMADRLVLDGTGMYEVKKVDFNFANSVFNQFLRDDAFINSTYYSDLDQQLQIAVPNLEEVSDRKLLTELVKAVDTTTAGQMFDVDFGTRPWATKIRLDHSMRHKSLPAYSNEVVAEKIEEMYGRRPMEKDIGPGGGPAKYLSPFKTRQRLQAMSHVVLSKVSDVDFALKILDRNIELFQEAIRNPSPDTKANIRDAMEEARVAEENVEDYWWVPGELGYEEALASVRESEPDFNPKGKFVPSRQVPGYRRAQNELVAQQKRVEYLLVKEKSRQERDRQLLMYLTDYRTRVDRALEHFGKPADPTEPPGLGQPLSDIMKRDLAR